jgi:hypothetical protein
MPQEEGDHNIMQHTPCSPNSKTCHKKKETERAAHATARHASRRRKESMQHTPRQQEMPQKEGNRTCSTRDSKTWHKKKESEYAAHATARHGSRRTKQNMQHTLCNLDSKTCQKKETQHAAQAPTEKLDTRRRKQNMQHTPQQQDMPQEEDKHNKQHTPCSLDSKTCHKKKKTEHAAHAPTARHATRRRKHNKQHIILTSETNLNLRIRIKMPQRKAI